MKIKTFKLAKDVTKEQLLEKGFKEGSWQSQYDDKECVSRRVHLYGDIELHITIQTDPLNFDDYDDTLVLDDSFCQPYTPFYGDDYKKEIEFGSFPFLEKIVYRYNNEMEKLGIFEEVATCK